MSDYYDTIYRQVVNKLQNVSTRPFSDKDENLVDFSCAIMIRERNGITDYDVVVSGEIICGTNQIKQKTETITIQVDTHKLSNSYYLLQYTDRLTYQLCNATLQNY